MITPFDFLQWAEEQRFFFPPSARDFLSVVESPAEAWFACEFLWRGDAIQYGRIGHSTIASIRGGTVAFGLQMDFAGFRPDAVLVTPRLMLAIEIDGAFHNERRDYDYQKDRMMVRAGAIPIRFTALEAIHGADRCWQEIDSILASRRAL